MRCQRLKGAKYGRHAALKITKRRFTHSAIAQTIQIGAPLMISGSAASCALPANTSSDISTASGMPSPLLAIATPVTRPQAAMPSETPTMSRAPLRNSGWRQIGGAEILLMRTIVL